jgi:hypothetical protein
MPASLFHGVPQSVRIIALAITGRAEISNIGHGSNPVARRLVA